jgi:hypothetical protein
MKHALLSVPLLAFALLWLPSAQAASPIDAGGGQPGAPAGTVEGFESTPNGVYNVLYVSNMKITRPLAMSDGYPPGEFAILLLDKGNGAQPGLRGNVLDSYAVLQDYTNAPWHADFDRPMQSFSINVGDPPGHDAETVWLQAYDNNGNLIAQTQVDRPKDALTASRLTVTANATTGPIYSVIFGTSGGVNSCTVFWDNIALQYYY